MWKRTENVYIFLKGNYRRSQGLTSRFWEGSDAWFKNPFIVSRVSQYWRFLPGNSVLANLWLLIVEGGWTNSVVSEHWFIWKYTQNIKAVLHYDSQELSVIPFGISTHRGSGHLLHNIISFCDLHLLFLCKAIWIPFPYRNPAILLVLFQNFWRLPEKKKEPW